MYTGLKNSLRQACSDLANCTGHLKWAADGSDFEGGSWVTSLVEADAGRACVYEASNFSRTTLDRRVLSLS